VFAVASETGWSEQRILFMPLARLTQYHHCLLRRNGVRTHWSSPATGTLNGQTLSEHLAKLRSQWHASVDSESEDIP